MRHALLFVILILLGSCSEAVSLIIENRSGAGVTIISQVRTDRHTYILTASQSQEISWPDPNHYIVVRSAKCSRQFDLDEFYSPWNEWRDGNGELSRRYAVQPDGMLQILRPSNDKGAYLGLQDPPNWKTKTLVPLSEECNGS